MEEDYNDRNYRPLNRGSKLQPRTVEPPGVTEFKPVVASIMGPMLDEKYKVERIGKRHAIAKKTLPAEDDDEEDEESPYAGINIDELWAPLVSPTTVAKNSAAVRTLRSRQLKILAHSLMEMIETETARTQPLVRLVDALQMDDPFLQNFDLTEMGVPADLQREMRDVVQDCVNCNFEFVRQISMARSKLIIAHDKKKLLAKKLVPFKRK